MFLYMIAELSAINSVINLLTGLDALPCLIVEVLVTTAYTCKYQVANITIASISNFMFSFGRVQNLLHHGQCTGSSSTGTHCHLFDRHWDKAAH